MNVKICKNDGMSRATIYEIEKEEPQNKIHPQNEADTENAKNTPGVQTMRHKIKLASQ